MAGLIFEWDKEKAKENRKKHRVAFEEASTVFGDSFSLTVLDPLHFREACDEMGGNPI